MFSGTGRGDCHIFITSGFTVGQRLGGETSQVALVVKNPPANAGDIRDAVRSLGQEDPLEEEMATHSSIHAWRIPWTEEPGGLQSIAFQRVGHDPEAT